MNGLPKKNNFFNLKSSAILKVWMWREFKIFWNCYKKWRKEKMLGPISFTTSLNLAWYRNTWKLNITFSTKISTWTKLGKKNQCVLFLQVETCLPTIPIKTISNRWQPRIILTSKSCTSMMLPAIIQLKKYTRKFITSIPISEAKQYLLGTEGVSELL